MAFLAPMFPELVLSAEDGIGSIVSGISTEFIKKAKQSIATTVDSEISDIANKNPNGMTNLTLNDAIKTKNHAISHPRKSGRIHKRI